jgi:prepilin-type N-terminal cleavage/methylation domain-containing protein
MAKKQRGFTLIELMTAVSIFIIIMTISMGSIFSVFRANQKSKTLKTAINSINITLETLSRELRFGKDYYCGLSGNPSEPDCTDGDTGMSFTSSDGDRITYSIHRSDYIRKSINGAPFENAHPQTLLSIV